jgi:hypothetical protein
MTIPISDGDNSSIQPNPATKQPGVGLVIIAPCPYGSLPKASANQIKANGIRKRGAQSRPTPSRPSAGAATVSFGVLAAGTGCRLVAPLTRSFAPWPAWRRRSFCFLHSYDATGLYWQGLDKAGLLRPTNGVRLVHSPYGDDTRRFNAVARIGGPLHQIIEHRKCHFIVDRVAGGCPYHAYDFDKPLIEHYVSMLGGKLMGGQVHVPSCNVQHDWDRIRDADRLLAGRTCPKKAPAEINAWKSAMLGMEYGTLDDYAGRVMPKDPPSFWREVEYWTRKQGTRFGGHFSHCEGTGSAALAWDAFYKFGAAYSLGEMGPGSSRQSQFAVACLRGSARAAGKPWGIFFAPWCPKGVTCFIPPKDQSWQAGDPGNGTGGPSSALQRRILFHSYLSGAHTLHEEWGCEGNLLDFDAGTISSYGKVTRDLLDFQDANPDVGEPYTPVALVQDASVPPADVPAGPYGWNTPPVWQELNSRIYARAKDDKALAARTAASGGLGAPSTWESTCYSPAALPELFDVVPASALPCGGLLPSSDPRICPCRSTCESPTARGSWACTIPGVPCAATCWASAASSTRVAPSAMSFDPSSLSDRPGPFTPGPPAPGCRCKATTCTSRSAPAAP